MFGLYRANFWQFEGQKGLQDKPPAPEGGHYFPLPHSPIISSSFTFLANEELYILVHSLTNILPVSLPLEESWKYLLILKLGL